MNTSHFDSYQQGQMALAQQLKDHLKKTRNLDIELQWEENPHHDPLFVFLEIHKTIKLTLDREDVETFGTLYDRAYQKAFLEKQERRILKQLQQKAD